VVIPQIISACNQWEDQTPSKSTCFLKKLVTLFNFGNLNIKDKSNNLEIEERSLKNLS
jgi:hypothetical protein